MKQLFIFFFLVLAFTACQETQVPEPELPEELIPPSEVGAGFVSCLINGEVWNVRNLGNANSSLTAGGLRLNARRELFQLQEAIGLEIYEVNRTGTYLLNDENTGGYSEIKIVNDTVILESYRTNTVNTGELIITFLDTKAGIISGTFFFDAIDNDTGEITEIRDGRFDIKY